MLQMTSVKESETEVVILDESNYGKFQEFIKTKFVEMKITQGGKRQKKLLFKEMVLNSNYFYLNFSFTNYN